MEEKIIFLLRGLPGSGKSTIAEKLCEMIPGSKMFAADDFFEDDCGYYVFKKEKVHEAHGWCQEQVEQAIKAGTTPIFVHNTFTKDWEMAPYREMATEYGYLVVSLVVENRHGNMNIHGVPEETLAAMHRRFEVKLI